MDSGLRAAAVNVDLAFPHSWQAQILRNRPLILPSRHYTYPRQAEDIERGALETLVQPDGDKPFLATFALGFADPAAPSGLWSCPNPNEICALAGGYAYIVDTLNPNRFTHLAFRPVLEVRSLQDQRLLLFAGHHALLAWGSDGQLWESQRLSSEGLRVEAVTDTDLHGFGWDLLTDRDVPFTLDLRTGERIGS
ncbi:MAG: hypothetical protein WB622_10420 [Acidobacteriaceae bacterium]